MKKVICLILCFCMQLVVIQAESYCVLLDDDNRVVEGKDMDKQQSVASISKIMTAILAIEHGNLDDTWTCGSELKEAYGSSIYLKEGQQVSLKSLLYGLMLRSGNDAALEIAMNISENETAFVQLMNEKAQAIGMTNTVFHNASGLDEEDDGNLSTAYDMALLMSYAMKNETFREVTQSEYYTSEWNYRWKNKNRLLFDFPFANGGKTGFTKKAGRTLVTTAQHNGVESVVVTLQMADDFAFHKEKHVATMDAYQVIEVLGAGTHVADGKTITVTEPLKISVKKDGSDTISIASHFEKKQYVIEIMKNDEVSLYEYPYTTNKKTGGWFS